MNYTKILITGKRCTGKSTLFWNLQKELNWPVFSVSHFLRDFIRTQGLTPKQIEQQSKETSIEVENRIQSLLTTDNHIIIESRLLSFITHPIPGTCRILLTCDDQTRIHRSATRENISWEKAKTRLFQREKKLMDQMTSIYKRGNFFDKRFYDLTIDTTNLSPQEVLENVLQFIK